MRKPQNPLGSIGSEPNQGKRHRLDTWLRPAVAVSGLLFGAMSVWLHYEVHHLFLTVFVAALAVAQVVVSAFGSDRLVERTSDGMAWILDRLLGG